MRETCVLVVLLCVGFVFLNNVLLTLMRTNIFYVDTFFFFDIFFFDIFFFFSSRRGGSPSNNQSSF